MNASGEETFTLHNIFSRDELIEENLNLVRPIALVIRRRLPPSFDLEDLVQAGYVGLIMAAEKFDPTRSNTFATYAKHRIRGAILNSIEPAGPVVVDAWAGVMERPADSRPLADAVLIAAERQVRVERAIGELPAAQAEVIEMRFKTGLSVRESGEASGRTERGVDDMQRRAVKELRRLLDAA